MLCGFGSLIDKLTECRSEMKQVVGVGSGERTITQNGFGFSRGGGSFMQSECAERPGEIVCFHGGKFLRASILPAGH